MHYAVFRSLLKCVFFSLARGVVALGNARTSRCCSFQADCAGMLNIVQTTGCPNKCLTISHFGLILRTASGASYVYLYLNFRAKNFKNLI